MYLSHHLGDWLPFGISGWQPASQVGRVDSEKKLPYYVQRTNRNTPKKVLMFNLSLSLSRDGGRRRRKKDASSISARRTGIANSS